MSRNVVSRKVFFNLVKDLFKLNEGWSRGVSILVSSESAGIFDLGGLRKKYSCRCQILRSKECRYAVSRKQTKRPRLFVCLLFRFPVFVLFRSRLIWD